jgi:hypothetical protein
LSAIVIGFARSRRCAGLGIDRTGRGEKLDSSGDLAGGADGDRADMEHEGVDVDERAVADVNVSLLAEQRGPHADAFTHLAQHVAKQRAGVVADRRLNEERQVLGAELARRSRPRPVEYSLRFPADSRPSQTPSGTAPAS